MTGTIIAAGTRIAAEAGAAVAERGGNAVDAAIAATVVSMCTDTGIMSPGAGAFISVWPARSDPVVVDGYVEAWRRRRSGRGPRAPSWRYVFLRADPANSERKRALFCGERKRAKHLAKRSRSRH